MSEKNDLSTELKNESLLKFQAFFGNQSAKQALQKQQENKIIKQYFSDIVKANANKEYRENAVMSDKELRKHAQRVIQYTKVGDKKGLQDYVKGVRSLAAKKECDEKILLSEHSDFLWFCNGEKNDVDFKKYDKLQEYASFGHYAAVASLGKDYLTGLDETLKKCLNDKQLAEFRKQYGGKSFTEIYQQYNNEKKANTQKKQMDNQKGEAWAGIYR